MAWTDRRWAPMLFAVAIGAGTTFFHVASAATPVLVSPQAEERYRAALRALDAGKYAEAETLLEALVRLHPTLSGPRANLALVYLRTERVPQAMEALAAAIDRHPRPGYLNQLGILHRQRGEFGQARDSFQKALAFDPAYAIGHLNLGILYDLYLEEPEQALAHYQRYQTLQPQPDPEVVKWIADLRQRSSAANRPETFTPR